MLTKFLLNVCLGEKGSLEESWCAMQSKMSLTVYSFWNHVISTECLSHEFILTDSFRKRVTQKMGCALKCYLFEKEIDPCDECPSVKSKSNFAFNVTKIEILVLVHSSHVWWEFFVLVFPCLYWGLKHVICVDFYSYTYTGLPEEGHSKYRWVQPILQGWQVV